MKLTQEQIDLLTDFLDTIRDYELEARKSIGDDDRESREFVSMYEELVNYKV